MSNVETDSSYVSRWVKQPLTAITAIVGMIYGLGFAFGWWGGQSVLMWVGAVICLILFVSSLVTTRP